ncbi:hypothetical protein [Burkholderia lata]|uniref:hypothetical protein n=1 Tax=Burkholderia lata (strain ATCC 17760 / DSM 23089 / LMG 22485 / NCIMB 9086 / R18194 / 383) TaxID=482957 RepID=UPI001583B057|nr:hypothetical protein [Burkholderia lata]
MENDNFIHVRRAPAYMADRAFSRDVTDTDAQQQLEAIGGGSGYFPPLHALWCLTETRCHESIRRALENGSLRVHGDGGDPLLRRVDLDGLPVLTAGQDAELEAKVQETAARWLGIEEKERTAISAHLPDDPASRELLDWLALDNWSIRDGLLLLLGLSPRSCDFVEFRNEPAPVMASARYLDGSLVSLADWRSVNVAKDLRRRAGGADLIDVAPWNLSYEVTVLNERLQEMERVWDSGDHLRKNSPSYYVNWAIERRFGVRWLDWAEEQGAIPMPEAVAVPPAINLHTLVSRALELHPGLERETRKRLAIGFCLGRPQEVWVAERQRPISEIWLSKFASHPVPQRRTALALAEIEPYVMEGTPRLGVGSLDALYYPEFVWLTREFAAHVVSSAGWRPEEFGLVGAVAGRHVMPIGTSLQSEVVPTGEAEHAKYVVRAIAELGHDPECPPPGKMGSKAGKKGLRGEVKALMVQRYSWLTDKKFEKAWEHYLKSLKTTPQ